MLRRGSLPADDAQVIELGRALLVRLHRELEAQGIEHFVLGFHSRAMLENPGAHAWREQSVRGACDELGMHYLSARPYLLAAVDEQTERAGLSLFVTGGAIAGHYNARGNAAVFGAFLQALHGRYAPEDTSGVRDALLRFGMDPHAEQQRELRALGVPARLTFHGDGPSRCMQEVASPAANDTYMLGLRPEFELPARLEWTVERSAHFVASLDAWRLKGAEDRPQSVRLRVSLDGRELRALELRPGEPVQALEFELPAGARFALAVEPVEGSACSCWVRFAAAAFR
jgi:hypothetical protein